MNALHADYRTFLRAVEGTENDADLFVPTGRDRGRRLQIYRNNRIGALTQALATRYVVCRRILGEHCFMKLAHEHARDQPALRASLNHYGADFPATVEQAVAAQAALSEYPWLPDLARLEGLQYAAGLLPGAEAGRPPPVAERDTADAGQVFLLRSPEIRLMRSNWNVDEIVRAQRCEPVREVSLRREPVYLLVGPEDTVRLDALEYDLLENIGTGCSLANLERSAASLPTDLVLDKLTAFTAQKWISLAGVQHVQPG